MLESASYPFDEGKEPQLDELRNRVRESSRVMDVMLQLATIGAEAQLADEFLAQCVRLLCDRFGGVLGVVWTYHAVDQKIEYRMHVDVQKIETAELIDVTRARRIAMGESIVGQACADSSVKVADLAELGDSVEAKLALKAGLRSTCVIPLRNRHRIVGAMQFYCRKNREMDVALQYMDDVGAFIGIQLEHKPTEAEVNQAQEEQRRWQEQLKASADQAFHSSRLKSEFVANVSHEIRTPLAGIMGMAEMLSTNEKLDDESKDLANYILTSAHSLLAIVNDLLDFSKLEAGKLALYKTWFSINDLIETIARSARVSAEKKGLMVRTRIDERIPEKLLGDNARLTQILMNFAHNAVKFTERGEVTISADVESKLGNTIKVRFAVSDTGIGISQEAQRKLFEPFVQADGSTTRRFGGTGLGLSIARKLAQLMQAEIGLDSEEGVGSTFFIVVPLELDVEEMVG